MTEEKRGNEHQKPQLKVLNKIDEVERMQLSKVVTATRILSSTAVPAERNVFEVEDKGFYEKGDIHSVKGPQKCGKTTFIKVLIAALLQGVQFRIKSLISNGRVLYLDTEQSMTDSKRILQDVAQMTGLSPEYIDSRVMLHSLRRCDRDQLLKLLYILVEDNIPDIVFIDGLVDFVRSFNDEVESKEIIHQLQVIADVYNCAVVNVLHTNKAEDDHNMRGHLGTILAQKSGTILECKKVGDIFKVICTDSRHAEVPTLCFKYDEEGHIVDANANYQQYEEHRKAEQDRKKRETAAQEDKLRLDKCLGIIRDNGGAITRKVLTEKLEVALDRKRPTVATYISVWLQAGAIVERGGMIQSSDDMAKPF